MLGIWTYWNMAEKWWKRRGRDRNRFDQLESYWGGAPREIWQSLHEAVRIEPACSLQEDYRVYIWQKRAWEEVCADVSLVSLKNSYLPVKQVRWFFFWQSLSLKIGYLVIPLQSNLMTYDSSQLPMSSGLARPSPGRDRDYLIFYPQQCLHLCAIGLLWCVSLFEGMDWSILQELKKLVLSSNISFTGSNVNVFLCP